MKSFPKQLLLDFEYTGEISVGHNQKKNKINEDTGKGDKSWEKSNRLAADGLQPSFREQSFEGQGQVWLPGTSGFTLAHTHTHTPCVILSHLYHFR